MSVYDDYEMTIGIECHVQLATKTKLFSPADNDVLAILLFCKYKYRVYRNY